MASVAAVSRHPRRLPNGGSLVRREPHWAETLSHRQSHACCDVHVRPVLLYPSTLTPARPIPSIALSSPSLHLPSGSSLLSVWRVSWSTPFSSDWNHIGGSSGRSMNFSECCRAPDTHTCGPSIAPGSRLPPCPSSDRLEHHHSFSFLPSSSSSATAIHHAPTLPPRNSTRPGLDRHSHT